MRTGHIVERVCKYCGRDLTHTRFKRVCPAGPCKEAQYQDRLAERRKGERARAPKMERDHYCQRCGKATSNRINCPHCLEVLTNAYAPGAEDVGVGLI